MTLIISSFVQRSRRLAAASRHPARRAARAACPPAAPWAAAALLAGVVSSGCSEAVDALEGGEGFTAIYESEPFQQCKGCHAPGAPGRTEGMEATQDWSTRERAHTTLQGTASGLMGNAAACNGVPFIGPSAEQSLLVAALDFDVRMNFEAPGNPDCTGDAVIDQTIKINVPIPDDLLQDLKDWVDSGAP